jgi:hypothetical protein
MDSSIAPPQQGIAQDPFSDFFDQCATIDFDWNTAMNNAFMPFPSQGFNRRSQDVGYGYGAPGFHPDHASQQDSSLGVFLPVHYDADQMSWPISGPSSATQPEGLSISMSSSSWNSSITSAFAQAEVNDLPGAQLAFDAFNNLSFDASSWGPYDYHTY